MPPSRSQASSARSRAAASEARSARIGTMPSPSSTATASSRRLPTADDSDPVEAASEQAAGGLEADAGAPAGDEGDTGGGHRKNLTDRSLGVGGGLTLPPACGIPSVPPTLRP